MRRLGTSIVSRSKPSSRTATASPTRNSTSATLITLLRLPHANAVASLRRYTRQAQRNRSTSPPAKIVTDECVVDEFWIRRIKAIDLSGLTWTQYLVGIET